MKDKRLTNRLIQYWEKLRTQQPLPAWERFNPGVVDDIWKNCCVWRAEGSEDMPTYTYDYVGASVRSALGVDATGVVFNSHFRNFPGARIVYKIDEIVKSQTPMLDESQFVNQQNKIVKYRSCLLPFGNKKGRVTHVMLGLSWHAF
jgi:hypothetical protein